MSKTIEGIPDFLTREQYLSIFEAAGLTPNRVIEMRMAHDGVHALVIALDADGNRILATGPAGRAHYEKHRIFIPVRDDADDTRTTRDTTVKD